MDAWLLDITVIYMAHLITPLLVTFIDLQGYFGDCCLTRGDLTNDDIAADLE